MSATQPDPDRSQIRQIFVSAAHVFDVTAELDHCLRDIPAAQRRCLNALSSCEGATMQELASQLGAKPPAISQIVERLVRRALVERRTDDQDRRINRVHLTPSARALIQCAHAAKEHRLSEAFGRLEPSLRDGLIRGLQALASVGK